MRHGDPGFAYPVIPAPVPRTVSEIVTALPVDLLHTKNTKAVFPSEGDDEEATVTFAFVLGALLEEAPNYPPTQRKGAVLLPQHAEWSHLEARKECARLP